ncbi:MAG: hypothetical protein FGM52_08040 [Mycobacterium sp.]|nr:hypothetical protein [Mycobacterium sp.]
MSAPEDNTRPVSVAELLARNERIGSPPVGGRRRRRRRNSDGVSVAELTGEIPVVRAGSVDAEPVDEESVDEESVDEESVDEESAHEESVDAESVDAESVDAEPVDAEPVYAEPVYEEPEEQAYQEPVYEESGASDSGVTSTTEAYPEVHAAVQYDGAVEHTETTVVYNTPVATEDPRDPTPVVAAAPPLASSPLPRRRRGPERSHDPRPVRRSSGAEQMAYDPVDESVNIADLVDPQVGEVEELRSYLRASTDTLFSGGTVADDLARRGVVAEYVEYQQEPGESAASGEYPEYEDGPDATAAGAVAGPPRGALGTLWGSAVAVLQSLLAVAFGAGLFIGFDQLWRWNNLVALVLSMLVVLTLAAAVRLVRKTEDIVSTLTAVAVGLLVTLGPLALQST